MWTLRHRLVTCTGEGCRASARIPTSCPWSRSARSSRSSIPSSARAPARRSPTRCLPHRQRKPKRLGRRRRDASIARTRSGRASPPRSGSSFSECSSAAPRSRTRRTRRASSRSPRTPASAGLHPTRLPSRPSPVPSASRGYNRASPGAIAQLGERLDRTQEVRGSSPRSSTKS